MQPQIKLISEADVADLAFGCALLGTGGGGSVGGSSLQLAQALREHGPVPVVPLEDLPEDGLIMPLSGVGAPTVGYEMLSNGGEGALIRAAIEKEYGTEVVAVMASEIGGGNGVEGVMWAARLGLPVVDADGMGRAFPEVQMGSFHVAGLDVRPIVMCDIQGNTAVFHPVDSSWSEPMARAFAVASGGTALMADYSMTAGEMRGNVVNRSVSLATVTGRAARLSADPVAAIRDAFDASDLIAGKVTELERRTGGGFVRGSLVIEGLGDDRGRSVRIDIQNENLIATEGDRVLASVPDLITLVDSQTGTAVATEELAHGMRVSALGWAADPLWRTERGLLTVGPRAFGYDLDYTPIEELQHG